MSVPRIILKPWIYTYKSKENMIENSFVCDLTTDKIRYIFYMFENYIYRLQTIFNTL